MTRYGIIDMGSNSIRLCAYDVSPGVVPTRPDQITEVIDEKITAGLAAFAKTGAMSAEGIRRSIDATSELITTALQVECDELRIFATAVVRNASNTDEILSAIETECGCEIDVLSGDREARLGVRGALLGRRMDNAVFMDLGGGSTEITLVEGDSLRPVSIPQGTLSSFSTFVRGITPAATEIDTIAYCWRDLYTKLTGAPQLASPLYGMGGVLRAAAATHSTLFGDGGILEELTLEQVEDLMDLYLANPNSFTHRVLPIVPDRIHTLIPGCTILREVMRVCGAERIHLCRYGLREGYLVDMLANR